MRRGPLWVATALLVFTFELAVAADDYVGAERCAACHQNEYDQWKKTGHADALARLSKIQQNDATCRTCHTMVPNNTNPELAGVQCESCHGAGKLYEPDHVMRDPKLSKLLGLRKVKAATCAPCHTQDAPSVQPFVFTEKLDLVKHQRTEAPKK